MAPSIAHQRRGWTSRESLLAGVVLAVLVIVYLLDRELWIRAGLTLGIGVGVSLVVYGIYLARAGYGSFFGVRTVAAMRDETTWREVQYIATALVVLLGATLVVVTVTGGSWSLVALGGGVIVVMLVSMSSAWLLRRHRR